MPKVNKKEVLKKLEEYAELQAEISKHEAQRNKKLDPFLRQYNEATKPIQEKCETKVAPLREKANALAKEIATMLEADRDSQGNPKPVLIESANAVAKIERKDGARVIDPQKFFNFVKTKNEKFWQSVSILVGKAASVISEKDIDDMSEKKTTFSFSISTRK